MYTEIMQCCLLFGFLSLLFLPSGPSVILVSIQEKIKLFRKPQVERPLSGVSSSALLPPGECPAAAEPEGAETAAAVPEAGCRGQPEGGPAACGRGQGDSSAFLASYRPDYHLPIQISVSI